MNSPDVSNGWTHTEIGIAFLIFEYFRHCEPLGLAANLYALRLTASAEGDIRAPVKDSIIVRVP